MSKSTNTEYIIPKFQVLNTTPQTQQPSTHITPSLGLGGMFNQFP